LVKAPQGDPMYEFLAASGGVGPDSRLNLACNGKINVKVINALLGGATGGLGSLASTQNLAGILAGVLEGAGSSLQDDDFRDVSFNLGGTFDKPSVSNIKVGPGKKKEATPSEPARPEETPLPQKILEQVIPGAKPQEQPPPGAPPSEEPPSLKDKILQQIIPGAKAEPKAPEKPPAAVTTPAAPAPKPVKEKPGPVTPSAVVVEQDRQAPPGEEPKGEAKSGQEPGGEPSQEKEEAPPAPTAHEDVKDAPAEPGQGPLPEPAKLPKVKTFREPPAQGVTSPDQPAAEPPESPGDTEAGDEPAPETGEEAQPGE